MKNIKGTVLGAFSIVIIVSLLSSAISFFGYTHVINSIKSIQINKSNQDMIQELNQLSSQRQQLLTRSVISMENIEQSNLEAIGNNINSIAKKLSDANISEEDKKLVKELIDINNQYSELYLSSMAEDIKSFENINIAELVKKAQAIYQDIEKGQNALKDSISVQLDSRIDDTANDIIDLNRRVKLIYSDSSNIDEEFIEINRLLSDILVQTQNGEQSEELNTKIEDLKQRLTIVWNSSQMILQNAAPVDGFDRVFNMKKITSDLNSYKNINQLVALSNENNINVMRSASTFEDNYSDFKNTSALIEQFLNELEKVDVADGTISNLKSLFSSYNGVSEEIYKRTAIMRDASITNGYDSLTEMNDKFADNTNKLRLSFNNYFADDIQTSEKIKKTIFWVIIGITALSIIIGMTIALFLSKKIAKPIKSLNTILAKVETGDLTVRADVEGKNDIGDLGKQVNNVLDGQQRMVEQFKETSKEITTLKQRLSLLVKQNKDSIGKLSDSNLNKSNEKRVLDTESILTEVKKVNEHTQKAVGDSIRAIEVAKSREKTVEEAELVINSINETVKSIASSISKLESSSDKIGEITNTITQIASQTNLLALNAAIEANRAGQQGKGFAVVADEIRKLSNASNQSAAEIKSQIKEIQESISFAAEKMNAGVIGVEDGASRINEVKEGIAEIIESVNMVADTIKTSADKAYNHYETTMQFVEVLDSATKNEKETAAGGNINDIIELQINTLKDLDQITRLLHDASDELINISDKVKI